MRCFELAMCNVQCAIVGVTKLRVDSEAKKKFISLGINLKMYPLLIAHCSLLIAHCSLKLCCEQIRLLKNKL